MKVDSFLAGGALLRPISNFYIIISLADALFALAGSFTVSSVLISLSRCYCRKRGEAAQFSIAASFLSLCASRSWCSLSLEIGQIGKDDISTILTLITGLVMATIECYH